jgi:hypothetical protein
VKRETSEAPEAKFSRLRISAQLLSLGHNMVTCELRDEEKGLVPESEL